MRKKPKKKIEVTNFEDQDTEGQQNEDSELIKQVENFVFGMLKTYSNMSCERIHSMLSNYLPNYSMNTAQLNSFLQKLVKEDKLEFSQNEYHIKK